MEDISKCCKAPVRLHGDITCYYVCTKCDKACDLYVENNRMEETLKKFDEKFVMETNKGKRLKCIYCGSDQTDKIKQFITQALQDQLKDLEEKVVGEEKTDEYYVSEILKEMNEKLESAISLTKGYNQKRQEIKQIFKEYK